MSIKHNFKVGDIVTPNVNDLFDPDRSKTLGVYLEERYGVDLNGKFEVYYEDDLEVYIKQGSIDCLSWTRTNFWSHTIIDLDRDDDECI
jgi:hypothetical protein